MKSNTAPVRTRGSDERTFQDIERTLPDIYKESKASVGHRSEGATVDHAVERCAAPYLEGRCLQGRYIVRELIGEGAYGRVYRAEQIGVNRSVAIKVMGPLGAGERDLARQFYDEAFAASRLLHPNVVSSFDYGETEDGLLYIVMEYLPGPTLAEVLRQGPVSVDRAINLVTQILGALEAAHAAGVIHADLKSENIILQGLCGAGELVKVIDFSIARLMRGAVRSNALWRPGSRGGVRVAGTPQYMAPEVILGRAPTEKADVYAVGVLLHQLLTGSLPFSGENHLEVMMQHLETPVREPSTRFDHLRLPPELERIILRTLSKDPSQRPDASSLRHALRAVRAGLRSGSHNPVLPRPADFVNSLRVSPLGQHVGGKAAQVELRRRRVFDRHDTYEFAQSLQRAVLLPVRLGDPALIGDRRLPGARQGVASRC